MRDLYSDENKTFWWKVIFDQNEFTCDEKSLFWWNKQDYCDKNVSFWWIFDINQIHEFDSIIHHSDENSLWYW